MTKPSWAVQARWASLASRARWALCAGALLPAAMAGAAPVAEVVGLSGEAQTGAGGQLRPLALGDRLEPGADVRTGDKGRVRLRFLDGSSVVVSDRSVFRIEGFEAAAGGRPRQASLLLELGLIGQKVAPSGGGSWTVRTPSAVTAVRGTEFMVEVAPDLNTSIDVLEGKVEVAPAEAADAPRAKGTAPAPIVLEPSSPALVCRRGGTCGVAKSFTPDRLQQKQDRLSGV